MSSISLTPTPNRWLTLTTVALAQLMVILDSTVVNIALPSAQTDLGFTNGDRQWVGTASPLAPPRRDPSVRSPPRPPSPYSRPPSRSRRSVPAPSAYGVRSPEPAAPSA